MVRMIGDTSHFFFCQDIKTILCVYLHCTYCIQLGEPKGSIADLAGDETAARLQRSKRSLSSTTGNNGVSPGNRCVAVCGAGTIGGVRCRARSAVFVREIRRSASADICDTIYRLLCVPRFEEKNFSSKIFHSKLHYIGDNVNVIDNC
jgi:hypothetical protein